MLLLRTAVKDVVAGNDGGSVSKKRVPEVRCWVRAMKGGKGKIRGGLGGARWWAVRQICRALGWCAISTMAAAAVG